MSETKRFDAIDFGDLSIIQNDTRCVLRFTGENGDIQEIELPVDLFLEIADQVHGAAQILKQKLGKSNLLITAPLSIDVGILEDHSPPAVGLRFDRGNARERTYELSGRIAWDLAKSLADASKKCISKGGARLH